MIFDAGNLVIGRNTMGKPSCSQKRGSPILRKATCSEYIRSPRLGLILCITAISHVVWKAARKLGRTHKKDGRRTECSAAMTLILSSIHCTPYKIKPLKKNKMRAPYKIKPVDLSFIFATPKEETQRKHQENRGEVTLDVLSART